MSDQEQIDVTGVFRNPRRHHIPEEKDRARGVMGFPWVGIGDRIVLAMLKGEERVSEAGVIIPDIKYGRGSDKDLTQGMVVSQGAGEYHDGNFVSPEHDYGILPGDVVYIWPNSGQVVWIEEREVRVVTPSDIIMRLNRGLGKNLRVKLMGLVEDVVRKSLAEPAKAGIATAKNPIPRVPDRAPYELETGDAKEKIASAHGVRTKKQFLVKE